MRNGITYRDGELLNRLKIEDGKLVRRQSQPSEPAILSRLSELRKNPGSLKKLEWGKPFFQITQRGLIALTRKYPALLNGEPKEKTALWLRLYRQGELDPYLVEDRKRPRSNHQPFRGIGHGTIKSAR